MVKQPGHVYLVGAGPGEAMYLTHQAQEVLNRAEVVLYDALVSADILRSLPAHCEQIPVGKRGGQTSTSQTDINHQLVAYCRQGKLVVRLKGGDPMVFGRAEAEITALQQADCPYTLIPGLSSALTAPLLAGIPLTDRTLSRCFAVLTAHDPEVLDWSALARLDTLVILMGTRHLAEIVARLTQQGRSPTDPIAIIHRGGQPQQRLYQGTLADIVTQITGQTMGQTLSPAVIVIGEVVHRRRPLSPESKPNNSPPHDLLS